MSFVRRVELLNDPAASAVVFTAQLAAEMGVDFTPDVPVEVPEEPLVQKWVETTN